MAKVLIVDDDDFLLEGLELSLRKAAFTLLTANSIASAIEKMAANDIDIAISDLCLPGSSRLEFVKQCFYRWPSTSRIILAGQVNADVVLSAVNDFRIHKFLTKPCPPGTLHAVIKETFVERELLKGRDDLINIAMQHILGQPNDEIAPQHAIAMTNIRALKRFKPLSSREFQLLELLIKGYRVAKVSEVLHISAHTARNHLKSIFNKLGVHSQQELIELVISQTAPGKK